VTLILGQLSALAVLIVLQAILTEAQLQAWGWRIPFVIGAVAAVSAFWLRRRLEETEQFKSARKVSGLRALAAHPRECALVFGFTAGGSLAFYAFTTYMQKFLVGTSGFTKPQATAIMAAALVCYMIMQPIWGAVSDRIGRRPLMVTFGVLGALCTPWLMGAIARADAPLQAFGLIVAALAILSCYTAVSAIFKAELFPAEVRALGVGFPYAVANAIFGGTAEYAALWFKDVGRESWFFWYVSAGFLVALITALSMRDTRARGLIVDA
jgi:MFS transporter, MHS family, alpha-ketoglutarate permease